MNLHRRGFNIDDLKYFSESSLIILNKAAKEICYLLSNGYKIEGVINFVGNHYQLSTRQRLALRRCCCSILEKESRLQKLINPLECPISEINIDGFNTIITLEVALSKGSLFYARDSSLKDLAGLRGSYKIIEETKKAIELIALTLKYFNIYDINFYLDEPISNSINLKLLIEDIFAKKDLTAKVHVVKNPDTILRSLAFVVTSDSIILDQCKSWINLNSLILEKNNLNNSIIKFEFE